MFHIKMLLYLPHLSGMFVITIIPYFIITEFNIVYYYILIYYHYDSLLFRRQYLIPNVVGL